MPKFEWDEAKNTANVNKHRLNFYTAQQTFHDPHRLIFLDKSHTTTAEKRYFCIGKIQGKVATVRFTYRQKTIRIIGAGYWRKERHLYDTLNPKK